MPYCWWWATWWAPASSPPADFWPVSCPSPSGCRHPDHRGVAHALRGPDLCRTGRFVSPSRRRLSVPQGGLRVLGRFFAWLGQLLDHYSGFNGRLDLGAGQLPETVSAGDWLGFGKGTGPGGDRLVYLDQLPRDTLGQHHPGYLTLGALLLIGRFVLGGLLLGKGSWQHFSGDPGGTLSWTKLFASPMIAVIFTYSGWFASAYVGSEVKDPEKNVPRIAALGDPDRNRIVRLDEHYLPVCRPDPATSGGGQRRSTGGGNPVQQALRRTRSPW